MDQIGRWMFFLKVFNVIYFALVSWSCYKKRKILFYSMAWITREPNPGAFIWTVKTTTKIWRYRMNRWTLSDRTTVQLSQSATSVQPMKRWAFISFLFLVLNWVFPWICTFSKEALSSFLFRNVWWILTYVMPLPVFGIIIHTCIPVVGRSSVHHLLRAHANCRVPTNFSGPLFFSLLYATNAALIQCHISNKFSRCPLVDNQVARKTSFAETIIRARFWLHMKIICIFFLANRSGAYTARSIRSLIGCLCHGWMPSPFGNLWRVIIFSEIMK